MRAKLTKHVPSELTDQVVYLETAAKLFANPSAKSIFFFFCRGGRYIKNEQN